MKVQCTEKTCSITNNMDLTRSTTAEKKAAAIALYRTGQWSQKVLAAKFDVAQSTISEWVRGLSTVDNSKHPKTSANPQGAGRRKSAPKEHAKATQVVGLADHGAKPKDIAAKTGVSKRMVREILDDEAIRREAEAQIDPATLSLTAQQKLDVAIRQQSRKLALEFEQRVSAEVDKRIEFAFPHLKQKQAHADAISASYTPRFSKQDCRAVERCLHPDTWHSLNVPSELEARLTKAFPIFQKMQKFLCVE